MNRRQSRSATSGAVVCVGLLIGLLLVAGTASGQPRPLDRPVALARPVRHELDLRLQSAARRLVATDLIEIEAPAVVAGSRIDTVLQALFLHRDLEIAGVTVDGVPVPYRTGDIAELDRLLDRAVADEERRLYRDARLIQLAIPMVPGRDRRQVGITYHGPVGAAVTGAAVDLTHATGAATDATGADDLLLGRLSHWYPHGSARLTTFRMRIVVPVPYEVIGEGELVSREALGDSVVTIWSEPLPIDQAHLLAGAYRVTERRHGAINLSTYLYPDNHGLADRLLTSAAAHLDRFAAEFGPYPRARYVIVETAAPVGLALASGTVLGSRVLHHDDLFQTSLAHEILHCWWGQALVPDPAGGNWSEGLVTYLADYGAAAARGQSAGRRFRRETLARLQDRTAAADRRPSLGEFTWGANALQRAIGYDKGCLFFYQLERHLGRPGLRRALERLARERRYQHIGWSTIEAYCSAAVGEPLAELFEQWLTRTGVPGLRLIAATSRATDDGRYAVRLRLGQDGAPYRLGVPVVLDTEIGALDRVVQLDAAEQEFDLRCSARPRAIRVDPDFHLCRRLEPGEAPPAWRTLLADRRLLVILPGSPRPGRDELYEELVHQFTSDSVRGALREHAWRDDMRGERNLLLLGDPTENRVTDTLARQWDDRLRWIAGGFVVSGQSFTAASEAVAAVMQDPAHPQSLIGVLAGNSVAALTAAVARLPYNEGHSYVVFRDGENVAAGSWSAASSALTRILE